MSEIKQTNFSTNTLYCSKCEKDYPIESLGSFISKEPKNVKSWQCSTCNKDNKINEELGCPHCLKNFWILSGIFGNTIECPHCKTKLELPDRTTWDEKYRQSKHKFMLTVVPSSSESEIHYNDRNKIAEDMSNNKIRGTDKCYTYKFAPVRKFLKICSKNFSLRKLYDPVGAYSNRVGKILGYIFVVIYLTGVIIGGILKMGSPFLLYALFGILGVALTITVIGLFIVYLIVRAVGISLLGAYLGVLLVAIASFISFGIGYGLGYGITWLLLKISKLEKKRAVNWSLKS